MKRILAIYVASGLLMAMIFAIASTVSRDIPAAIFPYDSYKYIYKVHVVLLFNSLISIIIVFIGAMLSYLRFGSLNVFSQSSRQLPPPSVLRDQIASDATSPKSDLGKDDIIDRAPTPGIPTDRAYQLAEELQVRLDQEIQAQNRKANLNLVFGSVGAIVAFFVLAMAVFSSCRLKQYGILGYIHCPHNDVRNGERLRVFLFINLSAQPQ